MAFFRKIFGGTSAEQESAGDTSAAHEAPSADNEAARLATSGEARTTAGAEPNTAQPAAPDEARPWWSGDASTAPEQPADHPAINVGDPVAHTAPLHDTALPAEPETQEVQPDLESQPNVDTAPLDELPDTAPLQPIDNRRPVVPSLRQGLAAAALRDIGQVRSVNQDSVFSLLTTLPREGNDLPLGLFVVADGMGGHDGGEVASRMAVSAVVQHVLANLVMPALFDSTTEALQPLMVSAVQAANSAIWEHAQLVGSDMGTTCTVALLLGHTLYIGHVGDSRLYLRQPDGMHMLTSDHSAVGRLIEVGQLEPSEAREHPLRSQLYRTVGQHPNVQVDFVYQPVGSASHLLLCSDGLWGMLDEDVLEDVLAQHVWPQNACRELIARANQAGGDDNISVIVVTLPITQEEQE